MPISHMISDSKFYEEVVAGTLLRDNSLFPRIAPTGLEADDFISFVCKRVFELAQSAYRSNQPFDLCICAEKMGVVQYALQLSQLHEDAFIGLHILYARIIREQSIKRQMLSVIQGIELLPVFEMQYRLNKARIAGII